MIGFRQTGEIKALAGVDFLTISPSLLEELKKSTDPVPKRLDAHGGYLSLTRVVLDSLLHMHDRLMHPFFLFIFSVSPFPFPCPFYTHHCPLSITVHRRTRHLSTPLPRPAPPSSRPSSHP